MDPSPSTTETQQSEADETQNFNAAQLDGLEKIVEEDEGTTHLNSSGGARKELTQSKAPLDAAALDGAHHSIASPSTASVEIGSVQASLVPPSGPETLEFIDSIRKSVEMLKNMQSNVISLTGSEPALIEINKPGKGAINLKLKLFTCYFISII